MKKLQTRARTALTMLARLKQNRRALYWILALDVVLAVSSIIVDWPWLMGVPRALVIFSPICSLYPLLLVIWLSLFLLKKKIPNWFSAFLLMGLFSYGILTWIYFPLYMSWHGVNFHDVGSIFWVTTYALQGFIIASEIKKIPWWQFTLVVGYFFFKDYSDRYLGTFLDVLLDDYPEYLKTIFFVSALSLHAIAVAILLHLQKINSRNSQNHPD